MGNLTLIEPGPDGKPRLLAGDVCQALEIVNVGTTLERLDDGESDSIRLTDGTPGTPLRAIVHESGLDELVLMRGKAEAKQDGAVHPRCAPRSARWFGTPTRRPIPI